MNSERLRALFESAATFEDLLARPKTNGDLWAAIYARAAIKPESIARISRIVRTWHFLVLSEDWCGDSINILPVIARFVEAAASVDMRIIGRDDHSELMIEHLTGAKRSRSIPVVILLDSDFMEQAWWGPRPTELQDWVVREGLALPTVERYRQIRTWYARDKGQTIVTELLQMIERLDGRNGKTAD
ncbi:MAG TPA: thioredoxin family protein [Gemmatimonadaceae bacterium]